MIKTVIFDMDGLLIDSEPLWNQAMATVFATMNIRLKKEDYIKTTGLRTSEVVDYWHQHFGWAEKSPAQVSEEILEEVTGLITTQGTMMEGAEEILQFFKQKHFKIGLASSSPMRLINSALNHFNLYFYFDAIHSGEHQDFGKPHPAVYLLCAEELDTAPLKCLVFEDSVNGLIAAKAARMKVIVVPEKEQRDDPKYSLADLRLSSLKNFGDNDLRFLQSS